MAKTASRLKRSVYEDKLAELHFELGSSGFTSPPGVLVRIKGVPGVRAVQERSY